MKKVYNGLLILAITFIVGLNANGQERVVVIEPGEDVNLNEFIAGDTTETGEWIDPVNTVYELKRNSLYTVSNQIDVKGTKLHIRGQEGEGVRPVIAQRVKANGDYPNLLYTYGDAIIENVRMTAEADGKNYRWNAIRALGAGTTVIFRNCIIEKQGGAFVAVYGEDISITIDRCEGRFFGQPTKITGNGRIIDGRKSTKYVKVVDSYFYNTMSTCFAGWGQEHKYVEFDHNTFVNLACENRLFQFNRIIDTVKVTNNIFMNCFFAGDFPAKMPDDKAADAKWGTNPGTLAFFFAPDSIPPDSKQWTISNNNVFYTDDFEESIASYPDTIVMPPVVSPNFAEWFGDASSDIYFTEVLDFPSVPETPTWVWSNYYNDAEKTLIDHGYFVPLHPAIAGVDTMWYRFDANSIDMSYPSNAVSATAATDGGQVGSRLFALTEPRSVKNISNSDSESVIAYPNPARDKINFNLAKDNALGGSISIYNLMGVKIESVEFQAYENEVSIDLAKFPKGAYLYMVTTERGIEANKFVISR